jgi:hypothetical protein
MAGANGLMARSVPRVIRTVAAVISIREGIVTAMTVGGTDGIVTRPVARVIGTVAAAFARERIMSPGERIMLALDIGSQPTHHFRPKMTGHINQVPMAVMIAIAIAVMVLMTVMVVTVMTVSAVPAMVVAATRDRMPSRRHLRPLIVFLRPTYGCRYFESRNLILYRNIFVAGNH